MKKIMTTILAVAGMTTMGSFAQSAATVDSNLSSYKPVEGISGTLNSIGSDTLNNLMTYWAEGFKKTYPNVKVQVEGKGSSTAPPALIKGTAQLGPMSRKMKGEEIDEFEKKYGYKPKLVTVAIDSLAVYVHKDNPIQSLTLQQVDSIFSSTRKRGGKDATKWGDLGLTGEWANRPISLYGRNSASGTYGYFKEGALAKGDFKSSVKEQPGSASVVQGVENDKAGIGYSGIGYKTSGVKALPIAGKGGAITPNQQTATSFEYPISRYLYVYVNKDPNKGLDPVTREFVKYVLSKEGQSLVSKDGYYPVTSSKAQEILKEVL
ncbi:MAG: PstS family phosphate ABC transporter substrate-binding protein [Verrucomicrobiota bacterium]|nr:PstS family phosphate ABC transporter substrate-binding protein [Verrucomicrobiota bacterium]